MLLALLASIPFLVLFILLIPLKKPAVKALPIVWLTALLISIFVWNINSIYIASSFVRAIFMTLEIMLIVLGAVWLLEIVKETKQIQNIQNFLASISPDARVQGLIIGWLFVSLMEGVAGFGTPAAIAAPLLVALGFKPILAVSVALIGNSVATTFGAAGTPILLGFGSLGVDKIILESSGHISAILHGIASIIIPISLVYIITREKKKKNAFKEMIPFSVFAWLVFSVPYVLTAIFIGPELPSILASLLSLVVISYASKKKFLIPKQSFYFKKSNDKKLNLKGIISSILPYILVVSLLLVSRAVIPLKSFLQSISISYNSILGSTVNFSYLPVFTPAFYFFISIMISSLVLKTPFKTIKTSFNNSLLKIKSATIALVFALGFVQLLIFSSMNSRGLSSMPVLIAETLGNFFGMFYPFVSPFIGAFGSFISGSNTVSNILFGVFQSESAIALGISIPLILALQAVGGAVGNMIAIHNVLAASATVGIKHQESLIIKKNIVVMLIYLLILGVLGMIAIRLF